MKFWLTKEEKRARLEEKLQTLIIEYKEQINSYCMFGTYVFIFRGFEIRDNKICVRYIDKDTPREKFNTVPLSSWRMKYDYDYDFPKYRKDWVYHLDSLERLGLEIKIKE